ncbi:MAG: hypothetical protein WCJ33_08365 [Pseudomonadota bacterium]
MNFESVGIPIARIGKKKIFVTDKTDDCTHSANQIKLTKDNETFQLIPSDRERDILYVTGASGSGKSWFCKNYIMEYIKSHPKNPIYVFSSIGDDKSIDSIKNLKRVQINDPEFLEDDIDLTEFKDSLVLFDDTDCIRNKHIKDKVDGILNMILETGRHQNISVIYTSHIACNGKSTRTILNEAHSYTIFPLSLGNRTMKNLLDSYLGLDTAQIKNIKKMKGGRHVTILKTYPMTIMNDKHLYTLNNDDV